MVTPSLFLSEDARYLLVCGEARCWPQLTDPSVRALGAALQELLDGGFVTGGLRLTPDVQLGIYARPTPAGRLVMAAYPNDFALARRRLAHSQEAG